VSAGRGLAVRIFSTDWGTVGVGATEEGVACVVLPGAKGRPALRDLERLVQASPPPAAAACAAQAEREIREYLAGNRREFTVPLDLRGVSAFERSVLLAERRVPYGRTITYGELAERIGRPGAARAVGGALARNPVPLLVPCHRTVAAGGRLGGFSGGPALKRRLLALESGSVRPSKEKDFRR